MVTKYIRRKAKPNSPKTIKVILKKDYPTGAQIADIAKVLVNACPEIFKKDDPYPTIRMAKYNKNEIVYEISAGKSRAETGPV